MGVSALEFGQLLLKVVDDDHVGVLVLLDQIVEQFKLVVAEPDGRLSRDKTSRFVRCDRFAVIDESGGHLLQLARHHRRIDGNRFGVGELDHEILLHLLVGRPVGHVAAQLDRMQGRERVGVLARLQQVGGRPDPRHDLLQRTLARHPVAVVAVDADEVLLKERALAAAQQRLVDDLALAEGVLQPVTGEGAGQPPPDRDVADHFVERLEAFAGRVFQPRQLIEHDAVESIQPILGQPLQVVVVGHDDIRRRR